MLRRMLLGGLCGVLLCAGLACAPKSVSRADVSSYVFSVHVWPEVVWLGAYTAGGTEVYPDKATVLVRVQDRQGQAVDGVPVAFELDPGWVAQAVLSPPQTVTHGGVARAIFDQARTTGLVRLTARVDNTTAQTVLMVLSYEERLERD